MSIGPPSIMPKKSGALIRLWRSGSVRCSCWISGSRVSSSAFRLPLQGDPGSVTGQKSGRLSTWRRAPRRTPAGPGSTGPGPKNCRGSAGTARSATCPPFECPSTKQRHAGDFVRRPFERLEEIFGQLVVAAHDTRGGRGCGRGRGSRRRSRRNRLARRRPRRPGGRRRRARRNRGRSPQRPAARPGATSGPSESARRPIELRYRSTASRLVAVPSLGVIVGFVTLPWAGRRRAADPRTRRGVDLALASSRSTHSRRLDWRVKHLPAGVRSSLPEQLDQRRARPTRSADSRAT